MYLMSLVCRVLSLRGGVDRFYCPWFGGSLLSLKTWIVFKVPGLVGLHCTCWSSLSLLSLKTWVLVVLVRWVPTVLRQDCPLLKKVGPFCSWTDRFMLCLEERVPTAFEEMNQYCAWRSQS